MIKPAQLYGKPWGEREFLIALYSYFLHRGEARTLNSSFIRALARALGRTVGSVLMRMENFASLDPEVCGHRQGLIHMGPVGVRVFEQWYERQDSLREVGEILLREAKAQSVPTLFDPEPVRLPMAFGRYEPMDILGEGGFGIVLSCINSENNSPYAMKVIRTDKMQDREAMHRFRQEIRALKCIQNPLVVSIYEDNLESQHEFPAFIMDLASCSLTQHLTERAKTAKGKKPILPPSESISIIRTILDACELLHRHERRIIHRDVNPNNILKMRDNKWLLADFGLAGFMASVPVTTTYSTTGAGMGTVPYGAPEQFRSFDLTDERADVYAIGILIWELFTTEYGMPDRDHHGLPSGLDEVFRRATCREPLDRWQGIAEVRAALEDATKSIV
ncbi:MAG TPA: serine/threonine-protein kinase [Planctomycetota bacterium]